MFSDRIDFFKLNRYSAQSNWYSATAHFFPRNPASVPSPATDDAVQPESEPELEPPQVIFQKYDS